MSLWSYCSASVLQQQLRNQYRPIYSRFRGTTAVLGQIIASHTRLASKVKPPPDFDIEPEVIRRAKELERRLEAEESKAIVPMRSTARSGSSFAISRLTVAASVPGTPSVRSAACIWRPNSFGAPSRMTHGESSARQWRTCSAVSAASSTSARRSGWLEATSTRAAWPR
jgi:hypothetical protein